MATGLVVDADVHVHIPSVDALKPHLPAHWRGFLDEMNFREPRAIELNYPGWADAPGRRIVTLDDVRKDVLSRADLAILNCYYAAETPRHPFLASAIATAVNSWLAEEWLDHDERLRGTAVIAPHDTATAVAEVERIGADRRFVQILLPARAWEPYGNRRYWPIWEVAARHRLALGIHYGGATAVAQTPLGDFDTYFEDHVAGSLPIQSHLVSLIAEGVFDEYPSLRVCVMESGVTWLPTLTWKMDTEWRGLRREVPWVHRPPSEYVREHVRLTVAPLDAPDDDGELAETLHHLGSDELLMFASDYPHTHEPQAERLMSLLSPEQTERLLWSNAADCFALEERDVQVRGRTG